MYTLTDEQVSSVETLIGKLGDSLIKSRIEKWLQEVEPTRRVTSEQMEQFVSFATHLPQNVQNFPQAFAHAVKNTTHTEIAEEAQGIEETADLIDTANESIEDVPDVDSPEDVEEPLHKLGRTKKAKEIKKVKQSKIKGKK